MWVLLYDDADVHRVSPGGGSFMPHLLHQNATLLQFLHKDIYKFTIMRSGHMRGINVVICLNFASASALLLSEPIVVGGLIVSRHGDDLLVTHILSSTP